LPLLPGTGATVCAAQDVVRRQTDRVVLRLGHRTQRGDHRGRSGDCTSKYVAL